MSFLQSLVFVGVGVAGAAVAFAVVVRLMRRSRVRRRAQRRVVEKPNSHYTSRLAQQVEIRHRWQGIALDRVHEINRGEVERLVAKADASGVDALRPTEQAFLDQIVRIAGIRGEPPSRPPARPAPDDGRELRELRERPA